MSSKWWVNIIFPVFEIKIWEVLIEEVFYLKCIPICEQ